MQNSQVDLKLHYLFVCRNIWSLLSITGSDTKPKTEFRNDCPCCHYVAYETDSDLNTLNCTYCPLKGFAWNFECEIDDIDENRYRYWSYYEEWSRANSDYSDKEEDELSSQRKHWASRMVYACNQAIEALLINS